MAPWGQSRNSYFWSIEDFKVLLSNIIIGLTRTRVKELLISKAGVFYNVKNWSSFIASKSSSKNLSNENKHCIQCKVVFVVFKTKCELKCQFSGITEILWGTFSCDNWCCKNTELIILKKCHSRLRINHKLVHIWRYPLGETCML